MYNSLKISGFSLILHCWVIHIHMVCNITLHMRTCTGSEVSKHIQKNINIRNNKEQFFGKSFGTLWKRLTAKGWVRSRICSVSIMFIKQKFAKRICKCLAFSLINSLFQSQCKIFRQKEQETFSVLFEDIRYQV